MRNYSRDRGVHISTISLVGIAWIVLSISSLTNPNVIKAISDTFLGEGHCQTCTSASLFIMAFSIAVFSIGGFAISYDLVGAEKVTHEKARFKQRTRIISFALAVSIASLVLYYWINLFVNGF